MTSAEAANLLREAGLDLAASDIDIQRRTDCFAVMLPEDRIAWFPANDRGREHLAVDRKVLGLIGARCTYRVPRVLFTGTNGWDLRALVPGAVDPWGYAARLKADPALQLRLSIYLAGALAEQHSRIRQADVSGWLPREVSWPLPRETVMVKLPLVVQDAALIDRLTLAMDAYYSLTVAEQYAPGEDRRRLKNRVRRLRRRRSAVSNSKAGSRRSAWRGDREAGRARRRARRADRYR